MNVADKEREGRGCVMCEDRHWTNRDECFQVLIQGIRLAKG